MPSPQSCVQPLTSFPYRKSMLLLVYILIYFMLGSNLLLWEDAVVNLRFAFFFLAGLHQQSGRNGFVIQFRHQLGIKFFYPQASLFAEDRLVPARRSSRVNKLLPTKFLSQCLMCQALKKKSCLILQKALSDASAYTRACLQGGASSPTTFSFFTLGQLNRRRKKGYNQHVGLQQAL